MSDPTNAERHVSPLVDGTREPSSLSVGLAWDMEDTNLALEEDVAIEPEGPRRSRRPDPPALPPRCLDDVNLALEDGVVIAPVRPRRPRKPKPPSSLPPNIDDANLARQESMVIEVIEKPQPSAKPGTPVPETRDERDGDLDDEEDAGSRPVGLRRWISSAAVAALLALALLFISKEVLAWLGEAFELSEAFGWVNVGLFVLLVTSLGWFICREFMGYLRLAGFQRLRDRCRHLGKNPADDECANDVRIELMRLVGYLEGANKELNGYVQSLRKESDPTSTHTELLQGVQEKVLYPLDDKVRETIRQEARNVAIGTAISPYGFLDAAIALWRNVRLVKRIAATYQVRPGAYGTFVIVRRTVAAVALADLTQEASTTLLTSFRGLPSVLSPLGQGLTNAAMTIRLGLSAMKECRPLPLPKEREEGLIKTLMKTGLESARKILKFRLKAKATEGGGGASS